MTWKTSFERFSFDDDECSLNCEAFQRFSIIFGLFTWDLFASAHNVQCPAFFTRKTNAVAQEWANLGNLWAHPPWWIIDFVVGKLECYEPTNRPLFESIFYVISTSWYYYIMDLIASHRTKTCAWSIRFCMPGTYILLYNTSIHSWFVLVWTNLKWKTSPITRQTLRSKRDVLSRPRFLFLARVSFRRRIILDRKHVLCIRNGL